MARIMSRFIAAFFLILLVAAAAAAGTKQSDEFTLLLHSPAVSADHVAFFYAGDLWTADRDGAHPRRLTVSPGLEMAPAFSPDGSLIAFTGDYDGNMDVYVVPVEGGSPRRLTFHPSPDVVRGWTPDGAKVLFSSSRLSVTRRYNRLFTVPAAGGFPEVLPMPMAERGAFSPDGGRIAYTPIADAFRTWKHYRGGMTTPIWIFDFATSEIETIPHENASDTNPLWVGDTVYFLSDRNETMNLFAYDTATKKVIQVTRHEDYDVKSASAGGGVIAYEQAGRIRILEPDGSSRALPIRIEADLPWARPHFVKAKDFFRGGAISPTGKRVAVEARGEILTVPAKKGTFRDITRSTEVNERSPAWSPDGKWIACFSDAGGEYRLELLDSKGLGEPVFIDPGEKSFFYSPKWSPDSKRIAYTDKALHLFYVDIEKKKPVLVDTDTYDQPRRTLAPAWSPDSRWIAYPKRLATHLHALFLYDTKTGEIHQVTDGMSDAVSPAFSRDGKYLYFAASTNFGLQTGWIDMTSYERPVRRSLYLAVLSSEEPSPFAPESDDETVASEKEKKEKKEKGEESPGAGSGKKEGREEKAAPKAPQEKGGAESKEEAGKTGKAGEKGEKEGEKGAKPESGGKAGKEAGKKKEKKTRIDFKGLDQRILALPVPARNYMGLQAAEGGKLFYMEVPEGGGRRMRSGLAVRRFDMKKRKAETYMEGVFGFAVSGNGKKVLYYGPGGMLGIADAAGKASPGMGRVALDKVMVRVDPRAEWRQMFDEAWRIERDFFYDPGMHGADWKAVRAKYRPFLDFVGHRADLNFIFAEMLGELVVGHAYVGGGDMPKTERVPVGLLGADFAVDGGFYRIAKIYSGENWNPDLHAPLTQPGIDVHEGDYILAVNGVPLKAPENIYSFFEETAGRQLLLEVNDKPEREGARSAVVVPVSSEMSLRHRDWVEDNRRRVDALSGGKVAYVYMPDTAQGGYTAFNRYFFSQQDKEAVIVDDRFNGGGSVADYIIDLLGRKVAGYMATREGRVQPTPTATLQGPKAMIINEYAGSGGDAMPYLFRQAGLGKLIGKRTWGGLVGIYDYPSLIDGGFITAPRIGFFEPHKGWIVENKGVAPDIEVEMTPKSVIAGHDPQLEKAVEVVMKEIEARPPEKVETPPYPRKSRVTGK